MFDNLGAFYFNNPKSHIFDDNWILDNKKIVKLKDHKLVIADFSSEHYGVDGLDHVYQALEQQGINFLLLTHDPNDHQRFNRMLFYPYWYHWSSKNFVTHDAQSFDKTYEWSCLNGNPRNHRIYNYFYAYHKLYFKDACFTFHNADVSRSDDVELDPEVIKFWNEIRYTLKSRDLAFNVKAQPNTLCNLPANSDSYVHLVTETTVIPKIFVSEKTWKPIASGQLFLIFSNPGTVSYLRNQGVDVFDDIIDHGYDSISNWQDRLHAIHDQLQHLLSQDLKEIYIATSDRRTDNANKFFTGAFDTQYIQTISQCINMLN
jgi:hypothetical protein